MQLHLGVHLLAFGSLQSVQKDRARWNETPSTLSGTALIIGLLTQRVQEAENCLITYREIGYVTSK